MQEPLDICMCVSSEWTVPTLKIQDDVVQHSCSSYKFEILGLCVVTFYLFARLCDGLTIESITEHNAFHPRSAEIGTSPLKLQVE